MAKAEFNMIKTGNTLEFLGARLDVYKSWVKGLQEGQIVKAVFNKLRVGKTQPQLGYWYAVLRPFSVEAFLAEGIDSLEKISFLGHEIDVPIDEDQAERFFKTIFQVQGKLKLAPKKRNMSDEEMSKLIDLTVKFLAEKLGAVAPSPTERT